MNKDFAKIYLTQFKFHLIYFDSSFAKNKIQNMTSEPRLNYESTIKAKLKATQA